MYMLYYASMLQCCHLVWILVRTDHPYLGVGCHRIQPQHRSRYNLPQASQALVSIQALLSHHAHQ
jgi:hypothetical protein